MSNVSPEDWRVNIYCFLILFTFFQLAFNSTLRRNGASDEDLGVFGRVTQSIWPYLPNSNGAGGLNLTLAGNPVVIEQSPVSPPAYEDCNVDHSVCSPKSFLNDVADIVRPFLSLMTGFTAAWPQISGASCKRSARKRLGNKEVSSEE
jgi:hypothetical protein